VVVLDESNAADLRDRYYRRAYSDVYRGQGAWRERYRKALDLERLDEARRRAIEAQRADFVRQDDHLADTLIRVVEASREYRTFSQFAEMQPGRDGDRIDELRKQRTALGESAESALNSLLGPELAAVLDGGPDAKRDRPGHAARSGEPEGAAPTPAAEGEAQQPAADRDAARARRVLEDPSLSPPMDTKDIELLAERLGWAENETAVLSSLYHDYLEEYDRIRVAPEEPEAAEDGGKEGVKREDAVWAVFEALGGADDAFFDNVAVLAGDEARQRIVRRHRDIRQRAVLTHAAQRTAWMFSGDEEGLIDLVALIERGSVPEAAGAPLRAIENGYEAQVTPLIRDRLAAARTAHRRMEMAREVRQRGGPAARRLADGMMDKWREAQNEARRCNKRIAAINGETLTEMLARLPDDAAWALRYEYNRAAYPDIFDDDNSAEDALASAYALEDLTPPQRRRISELASEFRREYFELSRQMVELRRQRDIDPMNWEGPRREDIEREIRLARLGYDRDELSARARTRLRLLLTEDQAQRTGELDRRVPGRRRGGL
jgi:hypothetical protein